MHDPPSRDLVRKIEQFTAARERDLSGCGAYVRLLNRDLPMFDSIWLDALVKRRLLTPFQADCLAQGREEFLIVDNYLLIDQIQQEQIHIRYLAQQAQTKRRFLIDEYRLPLPCSEETLAQLSLAFSQLEQHNGKTGNLAVPVDSIVKGNSLFVVHPYIRGLTVRELLIRRGRFPEALLKIITGQLLQQLRTLESAGVVHGGVRISNLILSRRGAVTLLNTGVVPQILPHWTLQVPLPFESYDGFAPEMLRDGNWTHQTDLYSAGCLLWQIACGRSPVYSADPLLKLRTHVSRSIPDVREYAPDIDPETAQTIYQLTRRNPNERPGSASQLAAPKRQEHFSGNVIRSYVKQFEQPVSKPSRFSPRTTILGIACILIMLTTWGIGEHIPRLQMKQLLLSITGRETESTQPTEIRKQKQVLSQWNQAEPLPTADSQGVLELSAGQTYQAQNLATVGPLQIVTRESDSAQNAILLIADQPWRVSATHLSIKNVTIRHHPSTKETAGNPLPPALLVCQSLTFEADQCQFRTENIDIQTTRAIAWKPLSSSEANAGRLTVSNCQFYSPGTSIMLGGSSRRIHIENCLKTGSGDFLELSQSLSDRNFPEIQCEHLTLRQANSFVSLHLDKPNSRPVELTIDATNCVFDLVASSPGLITLNSTENPASQIRKIDLLGQILLLRPDANLAGWWNPETQQATAIKFPGAVEGVLAYEMQFAGRDFSELKSAELIDYQGPRWNSVSPGIDLSQMKMKTTSEKKTASN